MEYRKRVDALVFFSLLLLGYFAAHAHGKGHFTDDVGVSIPAKEGIMQGNRARCAKGFPPCEDNKCYYCIGGRTHARYSTLVECSHACF
ncbi:protein MATERNALLY EXPRESSED GENE 2-like [Zea mays]|uniref:protein MATERNALLY EXPRESSED GENE 2-like n=1 Tax=Zea mays TaxID=4577 RepID=UPI000220ACF6|nr:protein MATERNALLY EXPRESSED GENE 2-like [Zea mays]|eukprot:XP_008652124.1 protein MATERNALLY EXPRESSED GENE 2-like [Zea mays]